MPSTPSKLDALLPCTEKTLQHVQHLVEQISAFRYIIDSLRQSLDAPSGELTRALREHAVFLCDTNDMEIARALASYAFWINHDIQESLRHFGDLRLAELRHNLRTQDNASTAIPIFYVQQRRRIYGGDEDYGAVPVWVHPDDGEATAEQFHRFELGHFQEDESADEWKRTGAFEIWETVTPCFTREAAEQYIETHQHNLRSPRVWVGSGHSNPEWKFVRRWLGGSCPVPGERKSA